MYLAIAGIGLGLVSIGLAIGAIFQGRKQNRSTRAHFEQVGNLIRGVQSQMPDLPQQEKEQLGKFTRAIQKTSDAMIVGSVTESAPTITVPAKSPDDPEAGTVIQTIGKDPD